MRPLLILFGLFIAFCGGGPCHGHYQHLAPYLADKRMVECGHRAHFRVTAFVLIPKVSEFVFIPERTAKLEREKVILQEKHGILQAVLDSVSEGILLIDQQGCTVGGMSSGPCAKSRIWGNST